MLARLQQIVTLSILAVAGWWLAAWWNRSAILALSGFVLVLLGYSMFLALEFVALHFMNQSDPVGPAKWRELVLAWWGETRTAPRVFCWRQPFRSQVVGDYLPENGRRGVVFVHGFVCNRGLWTPWLSELLAAEHAFVAVNLEPVFGGIDCYVQIIDAAVHRVMASTGLPPVLVCHSMGGLAVRAWLRASAGDARAHRIVTIGTPHHGTWLGQFSPFPNGAQMRRNSKWLRQLQNDEPALRHTQFLCWYSNCDNVVFPASTGTLLGADNRLVKAVAHVSLTFNPVVMATTLAAIYEATE
jgi:pimeloyl-ACP methyl ester carboxylesterase